MLRARRCLTCRQQVRTEAQSGCMWQCKAEPAGFRFRNADFSHSELCNPGKTCHLPTTFIVQIWKLRHRRCSKEPFSLSISVSRPSGTVRSWALKGSSLYSTERHTSCKGMFFSNNNNNYHVIFHIKQWCFWCTVSKTSIWRWTFKQCLKGLVGPVLFFATIHLWIAQMQRKEKWSWEKSKFGEPLYYFLLPKEILWDSHNKSSKKYL